MVAVVLVGAAGELSAGADNGGTVLLGLLFILLAQAVTAVQFLWEESLMSSPETTLDPVALVGYEGLWGLLYVIKRTNMFTFTRLLLYTVAFIFHI